MFGCPESAKKMREKGAEKSRNGRVESFSPNIYCEVILKFVQTEAYIGAQCIGNYQKKTKPKAITRIKWEETRNCNKNTKASKAGKQCWRGE